MESPQQSSVTEALISILQNNGEAVSDERIREVKRINAAYGLGELRDPEGISALIDALHEQDETMKIVASNALVKIGSEAVEPLVLAVLSRPVRHFRSFAIETLGQLGDRRAVESLITLLQDTEISWEAASALGRIGDPKALAPLIKALDSHDPTYCRPFVVALGKIGDPIAIETLLTCLDSRYPGHVRLGAVEALAGFGQIAIPTLLECLDNPEKDIQEEVAIALGLLGLPNGLHFILKTLQESNITELRMGAALALGIIGDEIALDPLVSAINEDKWRVRQEAIIAVRKIGVSSLPIRTALLSVLNDKNGCLNWWDAVLALGTLGDAQVVSELEMWSQQASNLWLDNWHNPQDEENETLRDAVQYAIEQIKSRIVE